MPFLAPIAVIIAAATLTQVAVAVSVIGAGLSIIGAVTKNKTLMTIGSVVGAVGAIGGIGAAMSGIGQMTVGQVASKAVSTVSTQAAGAAARVPGAASGIIAQAASTGTNTAQAGLTEAAKAAAMAAPKAIGGPVQNVATSTPVMNAPGADLLNPKVTNAMDDLADDAANKFMKGMSGQGAMNMNGSAGTGLAAPQVEQGAFVKNYLSNMSKPVEEVTKSKSLLDGIDGTGKLMLATTGGQAVAGLAAGWFAGESAEEQLDFQKEMYAEQKRNRSYAPLV